MRRLIIIITGLSLISVYSYGQVFKIEHNQPDPISISTGNDTIVCAGQSVMLGSFPTAAGGTKEYLYLWEPSEGLDDPTSPNPIATPTETTKYILTLQDANGCELSESINVEIDLCLGIEDQLIIEELIIYPNPSSGIITVSGIPAELSDINISVINSIGKEVFITKVENGYNSIRLDFKNQKLPRGIYFVKILASQGVIIRKVQLI